MKILQINTVLSYGSTGSIVRNIYDGLVADGHDCLIVYGRGDAAEGYQSVSIANKLETLIHVLGSRFFDSHGLFSKSSTQKLIAIIEDYKPDIIQLHNIHGYYLNFPVLFQYLSELTIPVVWLMHDQWAISGGAAYSDNLISQTKRTTEERREYPKVNFLEQYKRNLQLKKSFFTKLSSLVVVTPSDWLSNQMRESFFQPFPVYTIHNGIDLTKFKATNIEKREYQKKQVLGVAHKWDNRKGTDFFLKLAKDLENTHHFTMVGVDAGLKDNISKNKLPITMLQKTSSVQELVAFYQEADIFLNPTLQDNFPTVNIEAQACGTPVITFQSGGSGESIQDGTTGLVISQGHYDGLKQALLDWPFKNEQIQRNCIENSKKYDKSVMYHQYKLLYQQLMEKKNGF